MKMFRDHVAFQFLRLLTQLAFKPYASTQEVEISADFSYFDLCPPQSEAHLSNVYETGIEVC